MIHSGHDFAHVIWAIFFSGSHFFSFFHSFAKINCILTQINGPQPQVWIFKRCAKVKIKHTHTQIKTYIVCAWFLFLLFAMWRSTKMSGDDGIMHFKQETHVTWSLSLLTISFKLFVLQLALWKPINGIAKSFFCTSIIGNDESNAITQSLNYRT